MASLLLPLSADALARQEQDRAVRPAFGLFGQGAEREARGRPVWGAQVRQDEPRNGHEDSRNRAYPPNQPERRFEDRGNRAMPQGLFAPRLRDSREDRGLSPDEAAREIQSRHGGRVLSVQPDGSGYRVKTLKDGEVRIYQVSP